MTKDLIRAAGGIVHADGNIFFSNQALLDAYVAAIHTQPSAVEQEPVGYHREGSTEVVHASSVANYNMKAYPKFLPLVYAHPPSPSAVAPTTQPVPPFGDKRKAAMAVYTPPFNYQHGYVFDSQHLMVADNGGINDAQSVEGAIAARVRGWGLLGYLPNGAELQDEIGQMMADALNALYATPPPVAGDVGDEMTLAVRAHLDWCNSIPGCMLSKTELAMQDALAPPSKQEGVI